ncbi:hypothetical protein LXL04_002472 [Taraxacum kok-saghyz]
MIDYIEKKRTIADSLDENLNPISNEDLIGHLLSGLDSSYGSFAAAVMMKDNIASVDDLVGLLLQEEASLEQEHLRQSVAVPPPANTAAPLALNVNRQHRFNSSHSGSPAAQSLGNRSGSIAPRRQRLHCQLCNKLGHEAGRILLNQDVHDGLYRLPSIFNKAPNKTSPLPHTGVRTSLHGWHKRLAHPHAPMLPRLISSSDLSLSLNNFPNVCDACQIGEKP